MRVITGKYKGRRFEIPHSFKARPTTDFAKENLFNVLKPILTSKGPVFWTFLPEQEVSLWNSSPEDVPKWYL